MKKKFIFALTLLFAGAGAAGAQTAADIFNFSQVYNEGTARTMALGNAFTALGGDLGAISLQPAASGVFGHSEMTFTPSFSNASATTSYLKNSAYAKNTEFNLSNFAALFHFEDSDISFSVSANKIRDFNSVISAKGSTDGSSMLGNLAAGLGGYNVSNLTSDSHNPYEDNVNWSAVAAWDAYLISTVPGSQVDYIGSTENIASNGSIYIGGMLDQSFYQRTYGGITEMTFNLGGNVNDILYWGANLNVQSLDYNIYQTYSERAQSVADFQDGFDSFTKEYDQTTEGMGFSLKGGIIYRPTDNLRLGAAVQTPTWYNMTDNYRTYMQSSFYNDKNQNLTYGDGGSIYTPQGIYSYKMTTPFRFNLGMAYTFGSFALLSADYEMVDYSDMSAKIYDSSYSGDSDYFDELNGAIRSSYGTVHGLRFGAELKPAGRFSLRAGYQTYFYDDSSETVSLKNLLSFGIGLNLGRNFYIDAAYQARLNTADYGTFTLYDSYGNADDPVVSPEGVIEKTGESRLLFTLGIKF